MTKKFRIICIAALAIAAGCQTRITATKNPEQIRPVYKVANIGGTNTAYVAGYERASGGWEATARSPLWATEELKGLEIGVDTNGTVQLMLANYKRDLSTNAVTMAHNLLTDFGVLAEKALAAYASCGASLATAGAQAAVKKAIAAYITKGGNAQKANVTCENGVCTFTDGTVTEICADGSCLAK